MRVTLDIDHQREWKRLMQYFTMKHVCGVEEIEISARGGLHLIKSGLLITYDQSLDVRALLGEDENRLYFDTVAVEAKPRNILWDKKTTSDGRRYEVRQIDEGNLLALPWFSRVPRVAYVRRGS